MRLRRGGEKEKRENMKGKEKRKIKGKEKRKRREKKIMLC